VFAASIKQGLRGSAFSIGFVFLTLIAASLFYIQPATEQPYPDLFYNFVSPHVQSSALILVINVVSLLSGVFLIVFLMNKHELTDKMNFFPVFLYVFWGLLTINLHILSKELIINCFLLVTLYKLLNAYRNENCLSDLFLAAFCISITLYFSIACFIYLVIYFAALFILKPINIREFIVSILGFLCPIFIYECLAYLGSFDQWYLTHAIRNYFNFIQLPILNLYQWIVLGVMLFLLLLSILQMVLQPHSTKVKTAKGKSILWWWLAGAVFIVLTIKSNGSQIITSLLLAASFIIGDYLFYLKRMLIANLMLTLILLSGLSLVLINLGFVIF
jgi:hypothetical protein